MYPAICCRPWHQIDIDGAPFHPQKGSSSLFQTSVEQQRMFQAEWSNGQSTVILFEGIHTFQHRIHSQSCLEL